MTADRASLVGLLIAMVALSAAVLMRESNASRMGRRIDELLLGGRTSLLGPMPFGVPGRLLRRIGERLSDTKRFYSEEDIGTLESAIAAAGLNPIRVLPLVLGLKVMLVLLIRHWLSHTVSPPD